MRRIAMIFFVVLSLCVALVVSPAHAAVSVWTSQYSTNFADLASYDIGNWQGNAGNGELERYTPSQARYVPGTGLQLVADKVNGKYVSGLVQTDDYVTVTPGSYVQATIQVPSGQGFWPAFWMLNYGANSRTEFDISEIVSPNFAVSEASVHTNTRPRDRDKDYTCGCALSSGFHTYALWWERSFMAFSIDGSEFYRVTTNIPTEPMFVVFNLAVGGAWPGNPDSTTPFPSTMTVKDFSVFTHGTGIPSTPPGQSVPFPTVTASPTPTATPRRHHR